MSATGVDCPAGWVDVVLDDADGGRPERLLAQEVAAGSDGNLGGDITVRQGGPRRFVVRASGRLTLHTARLDRLP